MHIYVTKGPKITTLICTGLRSALSTRTTKAASNEHQLKLTTFSKKKVTINITLETKHSSQIEALKPPEVENQYITKA